MKKGIVLLLLLCLLSCSCLAEEAPDSWICLSCGLENRDSECSACGEIRGAWICESCGTRNLSPACMNCGLGKEESLSRQASGPRMLAAYPAARFLAAAGNAEGCFRLGRFYEKGVIVAEDPDQALALYQKAADLGHADACICIARLYDSGVMVPRDYSAALSYYQKAAGLGSATAYWYIGSFYEEGTGVEQNYAMAMDYYKIAADKGDPDGWMSLAYCYLRGFGVREDQDKALEYYQKAADEGSALACGAMRSITRSASAGGEKKQSGGLFRRGEPSPGVPRCEAQSLRISQGRKKQITTTPADCSRSPPGSFENILMFSTGMTCIFIQSKL